MKSEKATICAKDCGSNKYLTDDLTMNNDTPNQIKFQYECSFCHRELPNGGVRFDGIGACPYHYKLAVRFVDLLRGHRANYFNNSGVRK